MVKQEKTLSFARVLLGILAMMILSVSSVSGETAAPQHPELSEQEMLQPCADCHRETTPELEKEWFDSVHGIAMVKCYQCHGTFETFKVTPSQADCAICHADMLNKCPNDKPCWECHIPHSFTTKK